jgi:hypothetical protein
MHEYQKLKRSRPNTDESFNRAQSKFGEFSFYRENTAKTPNLRRQARAS